MVHIGHGDVVDKASHSMGASRDQIADLARLGVRGRSLDDGQHNGARWGLLGPALKVDTAKNTRGLELKGSPSRFTLTSSAQDVVE